MRNNVIALIKAWHWIGQRNNRRTLTYWRSVLRYAAVRHAGQTRKGASHAPYIRHPIAVCRILRKECGIRNCDMLAAAYLHDTLEDTDAAAGEISQRYGERVLRMVEELTNPVYSSAAEKGPEQLERARRISRPAQIVKAADKLANVREILRDPPLAWTVERKRAYVEHAHEVVAAMGPAIPISLHSLFDNAYDRAQMDLGCQPPSP